MIIRKIKKANMLWNFLKSNEVYAVAIEGKTLLKPITAFYFQIFILIFIPKYVIYIILPFVLILIVGEIWLYSQVWKAYGYSLVLYYSASVIWFLLNFVVFRPLILSMYAKL